MTTDKAADRATGKAAEHDDEPKGGHPGPVDEGKNGGMATRELAPELTEEE
ncbi:MAG: hypothetical protein WBD41_05530 [Rhodococcus sp. (in: high G+C Gram-positive bacteria)]|jgi:hypothetical protein|uniref:hypothetical protein n=1 Tax=Rhodococcus sp. EPR-157 TaxID=1813677 RepID=UPI000B1CE8A5|nr:hypothetical protein [Rhodococcus sp. EPR-157]